MGDRVRAGYACLAPKAARAALGMARKAVLVSIRSMKTWYHNYARETTVASEARAPPASSSGVELRKLEGSAEVEAACGPRYR